MSKKPDPFDVAVGKRLRYLRLQADLSQEKVADALELTFQQVQKYELGINRIAPSRLIVLSRLFKVPMAAFFPDDGKPSADLLINSPARRDIMRQLTRINSGKFDAQLLHMLEAIP